MPFQNWTLAVSDLSISSRDFWPKAAVRAQCLTVRGTALVHVKFQLGFTRNETGNGPIGRCDL